MLGASAAGGTPNELREPPVFASANGVLDVLIIAKPQPISLGGTEPTAWVYAVCPRAVAVNDDCPPGARTASPYGGVRLQLQPGDRLKIRLVNRLPAAPADAIHAQADAAMLAANPTNLHTHGLLVSPHRASKDDPAYGDYAYVLDYPRGKKPAMQMPGMDLVDGAVDYDIRIPRGHPAGLYWFHPHAHGLALNQVSYGLAGMLTIGERFGRAGGIEVRHLILKDMQVLKDGSVLSQEDTRFCNTFAFPSEPARDGFCAGTVENNGVSRVGGKWFFTINGQLFPTITVGSAGNVWRIANASGSASYLVNLVDDTSHKPLPFQVLSTDGVSVAVPQGMPIEGARPVAAAVPCSHPFPGSAKPVCTTQLLLMPSSRVEVYVPPQTGGRTATLVQASYGTGPAGNAWPMVSLAKVVFGGATQKVAQTVIAAPAQASANSAGIVRLAALHSSAAGHGRGGQEQAISDSGCRALATGHRRRIFFGVPAPGEHGLGYEELDAKGNAVPGTFHDLAAFDHKSIAVCLPLSARNAPVEEIWELINVSGEDHNFHMHQTRFQVLSDAGGGDIGRWMDGIPVPHGSWGCDGTIARWRVGACAVVPVVVKVKFTETGDFAYHCHILDHEDAGMMAHIRVIDGR